ncbi:MAG: CoA-binding protein [Leadbetterella sp.]
MPNPLTLIIGASTNPERYAYKAANMLLQKGYKIELLGLKKGDIQGLEIQHTWDAISQEIDTVTLYLNPENQRNYHEAIISRKPKRVIFNPGTENPEFQKKLKSVGIETTIACTLVMLSTNQY